MAQQKKQVLLVSNLYGFNMKSLTDANFEVELANSVWLVVFWAAWCGPCYDTDHLEEFEKASGMNVGKINVDESPDLTINNSVNMVPTYMFFKNGKAVNILCGLQTCDSLEKAAKSL